MIYLIISLFTVGAFVGIRRWRRRKHALRMIFLKDNPEAPRTDWERYLLQQQAIDEAFAEKRLNAYYAVDTKIEPAMVSGAPMPEPELKDAPPLHVPQAPETEPQDVSPRREPRLAGVNPDGSPRWE